MSSPVYIYVTPFFPSPVSWRGAVGYDFVKALERQFNGVREGGGRWRIVVLKEGGGEDYEIGGVRVYTFPARRLPSNLFPNLFSRRNQQSFLAALRRADVNIEDVAVCHGNVANYAIYPLAVKALNPRCRALLQHHDLQSFGLNMGWLRHFWPYNMIQFLVMRRMHEKIDTHVFISEACRRSFLMAPDTSWTAYEDYKRQMRGLPFRPAKIKDTIILHNGVDQHVFNVNDTFNGRRDDRDCFVIGCIGNFQELKDQMSLLRAVEILKRSSISHVKFKIVFVGSGETLEACKRFSLKKGLDVEFRQEVRHEELSDFYRSLDLFVLPSWFEGFGCVLTEAYSCGTPFMTCEGQGIDDVIPEKDRDKWLCRQRDPEDLAKKIERYVRSVKSDGPVVQRLSENQDIDSIVRRFVCSLGLLGG